MTPHLRSLRSAIPAFCWVKGEVGLPRPLAHPTLTWAPLFNLPLRGGGEDRGGEGWRSRHIPGHTPIPRCASNDVELSGKAVLFLGFVGDVGGGHAY